MITFNEVTTNLNNEFGTYCQKNNKQWNDIHAVDVFLREKRKKY